MEMIKEGMNRQDELEPRWSTGPNEGLLRTSYGWIQLQSLRHYELRRERVLLKHELDFC
eukprot:m.109531 g.109531  ORF g.109531 m.109531 type:complete len:59 (-) comp51769_c0_seq3:1281-1457(-)